MNKGGYATMTSFDIIDLKEAMEKHLAHVEETMEAIDTIDTAEERENWRRLNETHEALVNAIKAAAVLQYNMEFLEGLK
jgi:hypothetical protein